MLFRNPTFGLFWFGRAVSYLGSAVTTVALVLYVEEATGSGVAVGAMLLAATLPRLLGPFAGTVVDRVEGRRLMVACDGGQALLIGCAALFLPPLPVLALLVAGASALSTLFWPAGRSAVPALVSGGDLTPANALLGSAFNLSIALGPLLGALTFALSGARGAFAFDALTFALSAMLLARLPALPRVRAGGVPAGGFFAESREGVLYVIRDRRVRAVTVGLLLGVAFVAVDGPALVFLVEGSLGSGDVGYGVVAAAHGLGMVLGPLLLLRGRGLAVLAPAAIVLLGLVLEGAATLSVGLAPALAIAVFLRVLGGVGNGVENVATDTLVQRTVPREMLGRVFGVVYSGIMLAEALAFAAWGPLLEITSPRVAFVLGGCGTLAAALLFWRLLPRSRRGGPISRDKVGPGRTR